MDDFFFDDDEIISEMYYHILWSTKNQSPIISSTLASQLYSIFCDLALSIQSHVIKAEIFQDHVQLVVKGSPNVSFMDLLTTLKSGSLLWIKTHFPEIPDFEWQQSDFGFTVSTEEVGFVIEDTSKSFSDIIPSILIRNGCPFDQKEIFE